MAATQSRPRRSYTPAPPRGSTEFGSTRPQTAFDSTVPDGVDPEGAWRFGNSTKFRRGGSTSQDRAGNNPNYTPGYGISAAQNRPSGFTPTWDEQFKTGQINIPKTTAPSTDTTMIPGAGSTIAAAARLPQKANTPSILPTPAPTASAPAMPPSPSTPYLRQDQGSGMTSRTVMGLPAGQSASSTFVPGQNAPKALAARKKPPVIDPLATEEGV